MNEINPKYLPLYDKQNAKKYNIVTGGRGGAKTTELTRLLVRLSCEQGHVILYARYTLENALDSVIPEFIQKIEWEGLNKYFHITKKDIINKYSGSEIKFRGIKTSSGNQTAKLKGIKGLSTFVVDEGEEWQSEEDYDKLCQGVRQIDVINRVITIMNPTDATHFIWSKYFENNYRMELIDGHEIQMSTHPDVLHIHTTYLDNLKYLPKDFIYDAHKMREQDPDRYAHVYLGKWITQPAGAIYQNWSEGEFNNELPFVYGMDFGWNPDPTVLVKIAVDINNKLLYVKCLYYELEQDTTQIIQNLDYYCSRDDLIVADLAEPRIINEVHESGFNIVECEKGPGSVRAGIKDIQAFKIIVESNDQNTKFELNNYIWNNKRAGIPVDKHNHIMDAMRYAFIEVTQKPEFVVL